MAELVQEQVAGGGLRLKAVHNGSPAPLEVGTRAIGSKFVAAPVTFVDITFPVGLFSAAPIVTATCTTGANVALIPNVGLITASGFRAYLYGVGGSWTSGAVSVCWNADQ